MRTKIIEVVSTPIGFWGKFMVAGLQEEWSHPSEVREGQLTLLRSLGWTDRHILVVDLSVGHGAIFFHGGYAAADIKDKGIYFCPMMVPFMTWLYDQDIDKLDELPARVELPMRLGGYHSVEATGAGEGAGSR